MLCQKCGLQEARVHLTSIVFRQKVEEHLCDLCAGDRAPPPIKKTVEPKQIESLYADVLLRGHLERMSRIRAMSGKEEVALAKRLEIQERKMAAALFDLPKIGSFVLALGDRLSRGQERFERVVNVKQWRYRSAYLKRLPKLVKNLLATEVALEKAWKHLDCASSRLERKKALSLIAKLRDKVRRQLRQFFLRPPVFEVFLSALRPAMIRATRLFEEIKAFSSLAKETKDAVFQRREIVARLKMLGDEQKMTPRKFFEAAQRATSAYKNFQTVRRRLMEAHLFVVIAAAQKYSDRGVPFRDLVAAGNGGLMSAIERFDYRRAYRLSSIAAFFVDEAIARCVAERV